MCPAGGTHLRGRAGPETPRRAPGDVGGAAQRASRARSSPARSAAVGRRRGHLGRAASGPPQLRAPPCPARSGPSASSSCMLRPALGARCVAARCACEPRALLTSALRLVSGGRQASAEPAGCRQSRRAGRCHAAQPELAERRDAAPHGGKRAAALTAVFCGPRAASDARDVARRHLGGPGRRDRQVCGGRARLQQGAQNGARHLGVVPLSQVHPQGRRVGARRRCAAARRTA